MNKIQPYLTLNYPIGGQAIDATQSNIFKFAFNDPSPGHNISALYIEYKEAIIGSQLLNTGWINTAQSQYSFNANTFVNGKTYAYRIKCKDNNSPTPIESNWSEWVLFKTSSRPTCVITSPANDNDIVTSDIFTVEHSFSDVEGKPQLNYQYKLYSDANVLLWTSELLTDYNNLTVLPKGLIQNSTYYKTDVTVTDMDGLTATSTKRRFLTNFPPPNSNTTYFNIEPDNANSKFNLKWATSRSIMGNYVGSGARYLPSKFGNGIEVSQYGEKVYWDISVPEIFCYVEWTKYNVLNKGTLFFGYKDDFNYIRLFYSQNDNKFIVEKIINGNMRVIGSPTVTVTAGQPIFYAIQQTLSGLVCHTGVNGVLTKWGDNF